SAGAPMSHDRADRDEAEPGHAEPSSTAPDPVEARRAESGHPETGQSEHGHTEPEAKEKPWAALTPWRGKGAGLDKMLLFIIFGVSLIYLTLLPQRHRMLDRSYFI